MNIELSLEKKEEMGRTLTHVKAELERLTAENRDTKAFADRVVAEMEAKLQAEKAARVAAEAMTSGNEKDRDVARRYFMPSVSDEDRDLVGKQANKSNRPIQGKEGVGAVRMYGTGEGAAYQPGLLDDVPRSEWQGELQQIVDTRSIVRVLRGGESPQMDRRLLRHLQRGPGPIAKMFADNATEGAELIPDVTLPIVQRMLELRRESAALFSRRVVTGGATKIPFNVRGLQPFVKGVPAVGELAPGQLRKSQAVMAELSAEPVNLSVSTIVDNDASEDSIVSADALFRDLLSRAFRDGEEDALFNGDTAGTHQDAIATWNPYNRWGILGASNDHRTAWLGLRALAFDKSNATDGNAIQTAIDFMKLMGALDVGVTDSDVIFFCSKKYLIRHLLTDSNLLTLDKIGQIATILTGQVGMIGGHRVFAPQFLTSDLATTGLYTGSGATGSRLAVATQAFEWRDRRGLTMEVERVAREGVTYMVASMRTTFAEMQQSTSKTVALQYNLTT